MKRRNDNNDDDKNKGAMFPRLHVNDAEKGGPRAPPRNKMALYEQFTIQSQRYNSSVVPPNQNNSSRSSSLVPSPRPASQQRVFAVQVFELHRLLKVQKLIAGSPNFLLETTAFASKSSLKGSVLKKYISEFVAKDRPHRDMQKDVAHKSTDKVEDTAENAVPRVPPISAHRHLGQPTGYPSPPNMDPKMNPWECHLPSILPGKVTSLPITCQR